MAGIIDLQAVGILKNVIGFKTDNLININGKT
jgi:hypothetical protein